MSFLTLVTSVGLAKLANAIALGNAVELTEMAVGDGNGNPTTPAIGDTELVREVYRATINSLSVDPDNDNYLIAELVIPTTTGGWTVREVGVFDSDGDLFAIANFPETYKPELEEGSGRDLIIRIIIQVSNASAVTLVVDPAVVLASREWVADNFSIAALLPGGTTGQVLKKASNADGDTEWAPATDAVNVLVNVVEEVQTLSASQTHVILATCTTTGLAVYIEGVRLESDDWTADGLTEFDLVTDYPAGTKILCVQNEPSGSIGGVDPGDIPILEEVNGMGGLPAVDGSQLVNVLPSGSLMQFAGSSAPAGWSICDGSAISRTTYAALFAAIGTTFGAGNLTTTFNLPDFRGRTAIGAGTGAGDGASGSGLPAGTALAARARGQYGGAQTHTLATGELPTHSHKLLANANGVNSTGSAPGASDGIAKQSTGSADEVYKMIAPTVATPATLGQSSEVGADGAHNNMQPFVVVNYIIKH